MALHRADTVHNLEDTVVVTIINAAVIPSLAVTEAVIATRRVVDLPNLEATEGARADTLVATSNDLMNNPEEETIHMDVSAPDRETERPDNTRAVLMAETRGVMEAKRDSMGVTTARHIRSVTMMMGLETMIMRDVDTIKIVAEEIPELQG